MRSTRLYAVYISFRISAGFTLRDSVHYARWSDPLTILKTRCPTRLGFDTQRELIEFSLSAVAIEGFYLEFGVFTGGTIRFIARQNRSKHNPRLRQFSGITRGMVRFQFGKESLRRKGATPSRTVQRGFAPRVL